MSTLRRLAAIAGTIGLLGTAAATSSGCARVINAHPGCDARVAKAGKRSACHACISRGPRWDYYPDRAPGERCARR